MLKDAVMTKYDKNPDLAWARGKVSFNKKGPEITNREKKRKHTRNTDAYSGGDEYNSLWTWRGLPRERKP